MGRQEFEQQENICPSCGLPESLWLPAGRSNEVGYVTKSGEVYCCRECSEGRYCPCQRAHPQQSHFTATW